MPICTTASCPGVAIRKFEFRDEKSAKSWSIDLRGKSFTVRFGKIGAAGQTQTTEFANEAKARAEHDKLVAEKFKKGYVEVGAEEAPAAGSAGAKGTTASKGSAGQRDIVKVRVEPAAAADRGP